MFRGPFLVKHSTQNLKPISARSSSPVLAYMSANFKETSIMAGSSFFVPLVIKRRINSVNIAIDSSYFSGKENKTGLKIAWKKDATGEVFIQDYQNYTYN
uniref:Uncharacterized protein n=1 Tax=Romanomermis culicivorax TaxID=13658 RepID=A0A915L7B7_ROMCU